MTSKKQRHRAAAEVFREQNVAQQAKSETDFDALRALEADDDIEEDFFDEVAVPAQAQFGAAMPAALPAPAPQAKQAKSAGGLLQVVSPSFKTSEELQLETEPIRVRETGFLLWRRVIVPPNVYVVHTRMGRPDPVTIGLGISFRFNPQTDSFLVVPAAMQTIGVVANCISKEKQGINVLAYVQWQIDDFSIAYRKLDFSDSRDPLGIVNAQLREQAEAAIKDKIATMTVEEVLTDKEPVIEELTTRLKAVAEGRAQDATTVSDGLGIKIVTVQIKEALVSSRSLWENLQAPFRYEKQKTARLSQLEAQEEIRQKELEARRTMETSEAETNVEIERIKETKQTEALELRLEQESTRMTRQQESDREKIRLDEETTLTQRDSEARLEAQRVQAEHEARIEESRLHADTFAQEKAYHTQEMLTELEEDARLAVAKLQAEQERIEQQRTVKTLQSELDLLLQSQSDELSNSKLDGETHTENGSKSF